MPRRPTRRAPRGQAVPVAGPANHCRAVVRVDGSGIRKKIKKDYEKALRDLDNSRQKLDQFQQTDQPQFTRWLNSHFGALLTELRELNLKLAADDAIVFMVQNEMLFGGGSYARAYKRVMEQRDNPEPPPPPDGETDAEPEPSGRRPEPGNPDAADDPLKAIFEEMFGAFGPDEDPREPFNPWGRPPAAAPVHASQRLKELYRAVVRRLHPDSQREMTPQKTEWWHQAQAAYEAGDVDQLEAILTLCEIGESGTTAQTSVSLLQRITAQLKSSLREIKRQIAQRRRELAWNFSNRTDHAAMADQVGRELAADLTALRQRWQYTQGLIAKWKAAAEQLKPSRRRRPSRRNPGLWF
ncbi:MAG: hypothetical protein P4N60_21420 [Verrucomicrobiae bacterium]|nr:hypothetical protein [Verrucomicrobiae bacterium]